MRQWNSLLAAAAAGLVAVSQQAAAQEGSAAARVTRLEAELTAARQARRAELLAELAKLDQPGPEALAPSPSPLPALTPVAIQPTPQADAEIPAAQTPDDQSNSDDDDDAAKQDFAGLKFGVGVSFTYDWGENSRVTEAELINDIVRVTDEDNGIPRIMLESHYFFQPEFPWFFGIDEGNWGHGPFVALQPGTDDIIEAIGMGWMVGFRRGKGQESFNIGLGVVVDPNTRILGEGIVANQPLPAGESAIRYKEEMQSGLLLLTSFSF